MEKSICTIIGGGAVGCAVAYELSKSLDQEIYLIERNSRIPGENQSSRNSGVVHAGIYYPRDTKPLKAKLCVEGNKLMYLFCEENKVPCKQTGKLVVATNKREEEYLQALHKTALGNGVPGLEIITGEEAKKFEPNVKVTAALHVPTSGIVDAVQYVRTLRHLAEQQGVNFVTGNKVIDIQPSERSVKVTTENNIGTDSFETDLLINSAGLYCDEIARMINPDSPYEILTLRGEAAKFYHTKRSNINSGGMNIYPTPLGYFLKFTRYH